MKVDIYTVYKVKHKCKYSYQAYDNYGDIVFKNDKFEVKRDMQGGDLPRIELFARQYADGWDCWGNEV